MPDDSENEINKCMYNIYLSNKVGKCQLTGKQYKLPENPSIRRKPEIKRYAKHIPTIIRNTTLFVNMS